MITIEVERTVKEKKEIELPLYARYGESYWKVVSEQECIVVNNYEHRCGIETGSLNKPFGLDYKVITEGRFNEVFNQVKEKINAL